MLFCICVAILVLGFTVNYLGSWFKFLGVGLLVLSVALLGYWIFTVDGNVIGNIPSFEEAVAVLESYNIDVDQVAATIAKWGEYLAQLNQLQDNLGVVPEVDIPALLEQLELMQVG